ncbi:hypothetical protein TNCV_1910931 [Trichonephila clavipes]|nr:hypothetical protein TNCV_1910931 [Trichonephila clavipes]
MKVERALSPLTPMSFSEDDRPHTPFVVMETTFGTGDTPTPWHPNENELLPSTSPGAGITLWCGTLQAIPITARNFDAQFPPQREASQLRRCEHAPGFNLAETTLTKQTL